MNYYVETDSVTTHRAIVAEKQAPLGIIEFQYKNANLFPLFKKALQDCYKYSKAGLSGFWQDRAWHSQILRKTIRN